MIDIQASVLRGWVGLLLIGGLQEIPGESAPVRPGVLQYLLTAGTGGFVFQPGPSAKKELQQGKGVGSRRERRLDMLWPGKRCASSPERNTVCALNMG